ncbi:MAG: DUF2723 domain-containing protein [Deltaproteobacteria bacterium]|nr:DUF2723 domain-containing protein [Deltaproteobacteria bacterium]
MSAPEPSQGWRKTLDDWGGVAAGAAAALAVFAAGLWMLDSGPGGGFGGDVAASAAELRPSHAPGHVVHLALAKAATLLPAGSIAFRVRLLSALLLAVAAAFVAAAARRLVHAIGGGGGPAPPLIGLVCGIAAGLSGPGLACLASADVYALQAALGAVVLWGCTTATLAGAEEPASATARLVVAALAAGLATVDHPPTGLPLVPPLVLATALTLARAPRAPVVPGESLFGLRLSWVVVALAAGLLPLLALPLRAAELGDPSTLLTMLLGRASDSAMQADAAPAAWLPQGTVWTALGSAFGLPALVAALASLAALIPFRALRPSGIVLLGFAAGPLVVRLGTAVDRSPQELAAYLAVPAFALAVGLAAPAGLALALARRDDNWRRRVGWASAAVLLAAALLRHEARQLEPAAALERGRATAVAADALREPPTPGAVLVLARPSTAALVRYDEAVARRRPDVTTLLVPRLAEPGYARERMAAHPELAPLLSAYLGPAARTPALETAAERLAAERPVFVEPGRITAPLSPRTVSPRGPLLELLPQPAGRSDLALQLADYRRRPIKLGDRAARLAGSSLGGSLAWNEASVAVTSARIGLELTARTEEAGRIRAVLLAEAVRLAREAAALGAPSAPVERLLSVLGSVPAPDAAQLDGLLEP